MLNDYTEDVLDLSRIVENYTGLYAKSPEEIVCEKEVYSNYLKIIPAFFQYLDKHDRKILYKWTVEMKTQKQIAKDMKITQQAVSSRISKFPVKFKNCINQILEANELTYLDKDDFTTYFPINGISKDKLTGMPYEHYEYYGVGGYWGKKNGHKTYKTKIVCKMAEYLTNSICTLCAKCTSKKNIKVGGK